MIIGAAVSVLILLFIGGVVAVYAVLGNGGLAKVTDPRPHPAQPAVRETPSSR